MVVFLNILWLLVSLFLIVVILLQRGRGGGLAGALGGMGGHSAFGTRAGDMMTKVTVGVFAAWLLLAIVLVPAMTVKKLYQGGNAGPPAATPGSTDTTETPTNSATGEPGPPPATTTPTPATESKTE